MDLRQIFLGLQGKMIGTLDAHRLATANKVAKGMASELQWRAMLTNYLPERYIIYDCQYSPLLFDEDGTRYVPAESVYAVFEVKAHIDAGNLFYAGEKAASVRRLRRTSAAPLQTKAASADSGRGSDSRYPLESTPRPGFSGRVRADEAGYAHGPRVYTQRPRFRHGVFTEAPAHGPHEQARDRAGLLLRSLAEPAPCYGHGSGCGL